MPVKNNLGSPAPGLGYRCAERTVTGNIVAPYITWDGKPVTMTVDQALAESVNAGSNAGKLAEAKEFLVDELADGPKLAEEIKQHADDLGIAR